MKSPRWQLWIAGAAVAAAVVWALWPASQDSAVPEAQEGAAPAAARPASNGSGGFGFAGSALRTAVEQSGAPGSTPPLEKQASAAVDGVVEVRVLAQGKPRQGAHVRLYLRGRPDASTAQVDWRLAGAADTASDGFARIPAKAGVYLAAARFAGLAPGRVEFQRPSGERVTRVSVELQAGVSVSGRTIQKGTQEPVALAQVTLTYAASRRPDAPAEEQARANSDASGRFRIDGLEPGRYRATAQAPGYAKGTAQVDAGASKEVTLELSQSSFIEGRVVSADGSPAAGAEVLASGGEEQLTVAASESGSFSLEVPPRSWSLAARKGEESGRADAPVAVAAGATVRGVKIQLGAASGIAGVVVAASGGQPVPGAQVAASPHGSNGDSGRAVTDAQGTFAISGLPPGSYDVDVTADGFVDATRRGVTVQQGQRFPLRVELKRTGSLEGVVRDSAGRPVAYALVRSAPQRFGFFQAPPAAAEARSDDSGVYKLSGVIPGTGTFTALRDGSTLGTSATADVPEGGSGRLDFTLKDEGVVTGHVRRKDGSPPPAEAAVSAIPMGGRGMRSPDVSPIPVDASGRYVASLPAGAYSLFVQGSAGSFRDRTFVTVEAGKTVTQDLAYTDAADKAQGFSGTVLEPDGSPSPGAFVRMGERMFLAVNADGSGRFTIDRPRADLPDSFELTAFNGGRSGKASVVPQQTEVVIQLQPGATLRGHLSGGPVQSFRVEARPAGGPMGYGQSQSLEFTGDRFEIRDLPALPTHLTVTTDDGRSASVDVTLSPGATQDVEVPLQPLATVTGRVVDAVTKQPIPGVNVMLDARFGMDAPVLTSADGRFQLRAPAGDHTLRLFPQSYRPLGKEFTAQAGQAVDLGDLELQKQAAQPGTVGLSLRGDSDSRPTVMYLIPDGPADKAGVHLGDQVTAVDGAPVNGVSDATSRIQGAPGTPVQLTMLRGQEAVSFTITRAQ